MINIAELLKDAPEGIKLYSPLFGEVELKEVNPDCMTDNAIYVISSNGGLRNFDRFGKFFYNHDGECLLFPSKEVRTWEGWKPPIETNFKVGDWVIFNNNHNSIYQISEIRDSYYMLTHTHGGSMPLSFSQEKLIRPWTIEDAKEGDVLLDEVTGTIGIFEKIYGTHWYSKIYCGNSTCATVYVDGGAHEMRTKPATKEQRDLLFAKMKEAGYEWDADKKELKKIQSHYDIAYFQPKQWVLVRDDDEWEWALTRFGYLSNGSASLFVCINGASFQQCIPFEGNEHLLGTTDMPSEEYINW